EMMQPAMHVGVFVAVGVIHRLQDGARLLRRGAVIELDARLTRHAAKEDREVGSNKLDVVRSRSQPRLRGRASNCRDLHLAFHLGPDRANRTGKPARRVSLEACSNLRTL